MINKNEIRKIVDEIWLNVGSINELGLYNGKAGIALAIFEAARFLQDTETENKAFDLFQETLVRSKNDCSFENGLSGIGYVLIDLIKNKYIDADFEGIFKEQCEMVIHDIENIDKQPDKLLSSLKTIYFLSSLKDVHYDDSRISQIVEKIFQGVELYLSLQFFDWKNIYYINDKTNVLQIFEMYLKLIKYSGYTNFSRYLMDSYASLYRSGRIASSISIGYYFNVINKQSTNLYCDVVNDNITYGAKNIKFKLLTLDEKINLMQIIDLSKENHCHSLFFSVIIKDSSVDNIKRMIKYNNLQYGYQFGLSRYLIYCLNKNYVLI